MELLDWAKSIPLDFATVISLIALFLSGLAHIFNRRSWHETYRPIVVAKLESESRRLSESHLDIFIENTGNRPACNIQVEIDRRSRDAIANQIEPYFLSENELPVLNTGEMKVIRFTKPNQNKIPSKIAFTIKYKDLSGRKRKLKQDISVKPSEWKNVSK